MTTYHRVHVRLSKKDRQQIAGMLTKGRDSARVLRRASILRQLDRGQTAAPVANNVGVAPKTGRSIARRYEGEGLEHALCEKPRPGKQRALDARQSHPQITTAGGTARPARLPIQALRHGQRVLGRTAQGRTALYQIDGGSLLARVRRLPAGDCCQLSGGRHHPSGDGQSEYAPPQGGGGAVRRERRRLVVGPIHGALHAQTRKLAEPGGDRDQPVQPPVPRDAKNRLARRLAAGSRSLEPADESRPGHHRLALHPQEGTHEVWLQKEPHYAVRDLVGVWTLNIPAKLNMAH